MKPMLILFSLLALAGCSRSILPAPSHSMSAILRPGQSWNIQNESGISRFQVTAQFPVQVSEAGCTWHQVMQAQFICANASDIYIHDERSPLALFSPQNQVTITYTQW
jgi:hypothetical protein